MKTVRKKRIGQVKLFLLAILAIFLILHLDRINGRLDYVSYLLRPLLIGLVLAYLCNPIFKLFEHRLFFNVRPRRFRRILSLLFTYIVLFMIFFTLIMLIVPQLVSSILDFFTNYEGFLKNALENINSVIDFINQSFSANIAPLEYSEISKQINQLLTNIDLQGFLNNLVNFSNITTLWTMFSNIISVIVDVIFGLFISLYILNSKEKRYAQVMRLRRAVFSDDVNQHITDICTVADRSFGGFLRGKLLDSTIVGILVYIIISIMQVPYAILIAVIIGITDIVPVIGPFIGVIPSAVIIFLTDPIKVIPFLLCILIVQQIDGNILAPKILGDNTGVSSLCVMIAITIMGAVWGLVGMVLGVPLFATVLELTDRYLKKRLEEKGLPAETEHYYGNQANAFDKKASRKKNATAKLDTLYGGVGTLTQSERDALRAYALVQKHGLSKESSKEALEQFHSEYISDTERS